MSEENTKNNKSDIALREERVLEFWKKNDVFNKSLEQNAPKGDYIFYDGPPFATGLPHYGHILGSVTKDVIGRYKTMSGFRVPRRWGWDCHGLPIENIVEKDLGISGKKAIEETGIGKFTEHARSKVLTYVSEWRKTVDRIGRWVDFDNSYKTMDNTFIESVWWALGELNKKELLYEGVKVLAYCPRCETPIANSEIAMDNSYKDITDISVYAKFKLTSPSVNSGPKDMKTYLLAWTTTPWTLPGNTAIAINKNLQYLFVKNLPESGEEVIILAKDRFEAIKDKFTNPEIIKEVSGSELVGLSYEPVFDYYKNSKEVKNKNIWKVWHADFVTTDMGTGLAHEAPAFGEEDMELAKEHDIPFIRHIEPNGVFAKEVVDFAGIKVKPKEDHQSADVLIIKHLAHEDKLFAKEKLIHSYPHCYRCETPLLYYALPSWFVNIQKVKNGLLENAKSMNWIPAHLKDGRFKNTMESAPDWTISRNRYWASPLPIWKSKSGEMMFVNSLEDLKRKTKNSGNRYFLMRHGQAENNVEEVCRVSERDDFALTEKGEKQVLDSIKNFKHKVDVVISSPLRRSRETTKIVCENIGFPFDKVIYDDRIHEWELSTEFDGKTKSVMKQYYDIDYVNDPKHKFSDGESFADVVKRAGDFIYDIDSKYKGKNVLIMNHAGTSRALSFVAHGATFDKIPGRKDITTLLENAEIKELSFTSLPHNENYELDLHRPYIDEITLVDEKGEEYKRIPEVIDCWFESGSMPFAQDHYPFENPNWKKNNFPADFVAEYIAQTRTWFYYTHVLSAILFNQAPFKNVVTTGTILAEDGSKMSKSKNNYPDPSIIFDKYGVDALRFYLMSSTLMKGEDVNFSEKSVQETSNKIINRLDNVLSFYELYRDETVEKNDKPNSNNILDQWILSRFNELLQEVTDGMEKYDLILSTRPFELFIEDLSTWYLRRSRERIKDGDIEAKQTLYHVLKTLAKLMAPFAPFTAEDIWLRLKKDSDKESVHLESWPTSEQSVISRFFHKEEKIVKNMEDTRVIITLGLEARQKAGIKVRQPLARLEIKAFSLGEKYGELIRDELNVKEAVENKNIENEVLLDKDITPELKEEGDYRELARGLQDMRKKMGLTPNDVVSVTIETGEVGHNLILKFAGDMKKTVSVSEIRFTHNDGVALKVDDLDFKVKIDKI